jgi:Ca2+-transporting ATPase
MTVKSVYVSNNHVDVTGIGYMPEGDFMRGDVKVDPSAVPGLKTLLKASVLCNGAELSQEGEVYKIVGDPTEGALLTMAAKGGITKASGESEFQFFEEIPFDSDRKKMTIIRKSGEKHIAFL